MSVIYSSLINSTCYSSWFWELYSTKTPDEIQPSSPIISSSHALLIDGPIQFFGIRKNGFVVNDDCLDDLIDVSLAGDLILALRGRHERGAKAYGQVVRVHHVLIAVLGQAGGWQSQDVGWEQNMYNKNSQVENYHSLREKVRLTVEGFFTYWLRKAKR